MKGSKKSSKIVVANWKMNPQSLEDARGLFSSIKREVKKVKGVSVIVCPPFVYLEDLSKKIEKGITIGAQDVFWENSGPFTGEVGPTMERDLGISYVIVGHSERRVLGDTDEIVSKKVFSSVKDGLTVILCVGETERDEHGNYLETLKNQIKNSLAKFSKRYLNNLIIAYEPVWAIGKSEKEAMTGPELHGMFIFVRKVLSDMYGQEEVKKVPILYGGSVGSSNASNIVSEGQVQGLLVGRQSLDSENFREILKMVEKL